MKKAILVILFGIAAYFSFSWTVASRFNDYIKQCNVELNVYARLKAISSDEDKKLLTSDIVECINSKVKFPESLFLSKKKLTEGVSIK